MATKDTKLEDFIITYDDVIAPDVCQSIIDRFEACDEVSESGLVINGEYQPYYDIRKGHEINVTAQPQELWGDVDQLFYNAVGEYSKRYFNEPVFDSVELNSNLLSDGGYKLQRTVEGDYYHWHHDSSCGLFGNEYKTRRYVFILYLNDGFEGGRTQLFPNDILSIEPKAGRMLWFPATEWYTHRCQLVEKGSKYIMTGWLYGSAGLTMHYAP